MALGFHGACFEGAEWVGMVGSLHENVRFCCALACLCHMDSMNRADMAWPAPRKCTEDGPVPAARELAAALDERQEELQAMQQAATSWPSSDLV